jgi:hypothetical protein
MCFDLASIVAGVILVLVQPFLPQSLLSNLWEWIQSTRMRISETSNNQSCRQAAEGHRDGIALLALTITIFVFLGTLLYVFPFRAPVSISIFEILITILTLAIILLLMDELGKLATAMKLDKSYR